MIGSQNNAGRDINYFINSLKYLRQIRIDPDTEIREDEFVEPAGLKGCIQALLPSLEASTPQASVIVLLAPEGSGRRAAGLRILSQVVTSKSRIFELKRDWDEPDVELIPTASNAGYLLNLEGLIEPLPESFYSNLAVYARAAIRENRRLIITASDRIWSAPANISAISGVHTVTLIAPPALDVIHKILDKHAMEDRKQWLKSPESELGKLVPVDAKPAEAARYARILATAAGPNDKNAIDEYLGWQKKVREWFSHDEDDAPPKRARRISALFLDGSPASVVLDCADHLLAAKTVKWTMPDGGVLAGPDAEGSLTDAGIHFNPGSSKFMELTIDVNGKYPGITKAAISYLWKYRGQLVPTLTSWLKEISAPGGPANEHLDKLAHAISGLAEGVGVDQVFELIEPWTAAEQVSIYSLAADTLGELAIHPVIGSDARRKLRQWASRKKSPHLQRAVANACASVFGSEYPHQALTRLRYILESTEDESARNSAISALISLVRSPASRILGLHTIVSWCEDRSTKEATRNAGRRALLAIIDTRTEASPESFQILKLLSNQESIEEQSIRARLIGGILSIVGDSRDPADTDQIKAILSSWLLSAAKGGLPAEQVVDIITDLVLGTGGVRSPLKSVIIKAEHLRDLLFENYMRKTQLEMSTPQLTSAPQQNLDQPDSGLPEEEFEG